MVPNYSAPSARGVTGFLFTAAPAPKIRERIRRRRCGGHTRAAPAAAIDTVNRFLQVPASQKQHTRRR